MKFPEIQVARGAFDSGRTLPVEFRRQQLKNLLRMLDDEKNKKRMTDALYLDLRKTFYEANILELNGIVLETLHVLRNLDAYTRQEALPKSLFGLGDVPSVQKIPLGVVAIFGAWNYPFYITLRPLVGAIAAGNCVIIKPSEICTHSENLIAELLPQYLDNECYHVITGDAEKSQQLLQNKFDHIFFTGSTNVGKEILKAAAPHLTPVTLELGGKSPVYMDEAACTKIAVKRVLWGKLCNSGQICLAPDYLLCTKEVEKKFIEYAKDFFFEYYGGFQDLQRSGEIARIVNLRHFNRIKKLLENTQGEILIGGKSDESDLWIEPTFVGGVPPNDSLMSEELFAPILSIVNVKTHHEAIRLINARSRPLALYVFTTNKQTKKDFLERTYSGGICFNDVIFHVADIRVPFGGIGDSGMGYYHGKHSVNTFSHKRAVLDRSTLSIFDTLESMRYPPFTVSKLNFFLKAFRLMDYAVLSLPKNVERLVILLLGLALGLFIQRLL